MAVPFTNKSALHKGHTALALLQKQYSVLDIVMNALIITMITDDTEL